MLFNACEEGKDKGTFFLANKGSSKQEVMAQFFTNINQFGEEKGHFE